MLTLTTVPIPPTVMATIQVPPMPILQSRLKEKFLFDDIHYVIYEHQNLTMILIIQRITNYLPSGRKYDVSVHLPVLKAHLNM